MQQASVRSANRLGSWAGFAVLGAVALACYWPALRGGFVWDDAGHVTAPALRSWTGLVRIWTEIGASQQYYPVLHSAFWLQHRLWGDATLGYHLVNVLLHATACGLLAMVLRRLWSLGPSVLPATGQRFPEATAWLAAFLFAVHPVGVESVAWISEQKNTLSLVFYLWAGLAWLDFHQQRTKGAYVRATVFFVLALGTKTVTASLPAALLVVLWWREGKLAWRRDVLPLVPWFLLAVVAGLFTAWVERKFIGAEGSDFVLTLGERVLLAGRVIWFYLGKLVWPFDLMFIYPRWDVSAAARGWFGYLAGIVLLTVGLWSIRRRTRGPLAAWLFFAGSLFPALGFFNVFPFVYSYVADHFQYLASLGMMVLLAAGLMGGLSRVASRWRPVGGAMVALLVAGLGWLTHLQSRNYADASTLYRATLAANPSAWMAHNNLALLLPETPEGRAAAIVHYETALRLKPDYERAHNNLGVLLEKLPGRQAEALGHLEEAVRLKPSYADARNNLGIQLGKLPGRQQEAIAHLEEAMRLEPDSAEIYCNLADVLATVEGRMPEALARYEQALQLTPRVAQIHLNYANALVTQPGRRAEALAHYEEAVRLQPDYVDGWVNLAIELAETPGRENDALRCYVRALQINPGFAEGHYHLANLLANLPGRRAEAIEHYRESLRLQPNQTAARNNLAVLLAGQGAREEARLLWEQALRLDPNYEDARRNLNLLGPH